MDGAPAQKILLALRSWQQHWKEAINKNKADEALRKCPSQEWQISWLAMEEGQDFPDPEYGLQTWGVGCIVF